MLGGVETTADRTVNHDHVEHFILSVPERNPLEGFKQKKLRITVKIRVINTSSLNTVKFLEKQKTTA